jgi:hypothetical protein
MDVRTLLRLGVAFGLLAAPLFGGDARAQEEVEETQMCVPLHQIDDRRIIDDKTILLKMVVGPSYKRIDLARSCPGLRTAGGFSSATSIGQLCKQDVIRVLQEPIGSQCIIDKIVTIDEAQAKELMARRRK